MQQLAKFQKFSLFTSQVKRLSFYCTFIAYFLSSFSCESPKQNLHIDKEDRETVDAFLRYMGISQLGIYTILGSKPVTEFSIPQLKPENESRALYESMPKEFQKKISFEKFRNKAEIEELRKVCNDWSKIQNKYTGAHFIIHFDDKMHSYFLVNIPLTLYVLREHHQDFSEILGVDFDPLAISKDIANNSSSFWEIFNNEHPYLMGLLFGYGEKNSKLFQLEQEKDISFPFRGASYDLPIFKKRQFSKDEKIENLGIPQFVVFQPIDEVVEKYLLEKKRIIQIYKGKDFAETTVAFLKGESPYQKRKKSFNTQELAEK